MITISTVEGIAGTAIAETIVREVGVLRMRRIRIGPALGGWPFRLQILVSSTNPV